MLRSLAICTLFAVVVGCTTDDGGSSEAPSPDGGDAKDDRRPDLDGGRLPEGSTQALPDFGLGARVDTARSIATFRVWSGRASRVELDLFAVPRGEDERLAIVLTKEPKSGFWSTEVPLATLREAGIDTIYYGYRTWGPNWAFDPSWTKGTDKGFVADADEEGNRFNPNKLLSDPYALELSHDPFSPVPFDGGIYELGPAHRLRDSGRVAPKGIVVEAKTTADPIAGKPTRALADDVLYEVQIRGFTASDATIPEAERGTYRGAARKAAYLKELGVTAVEFLPLHETQNEQNDDDPLAQNYWGYATLNFFAPDRRFAFDKSPGGPTREVRDMVAALHAEGIKVVVDVVYNHTGEGGSDHLLSFRGFGATAYYEPSDDPRDFVDNNGVGPNFHPQSAPARQLVVDSLAYWASYVGVDGFRFDLASVLGDRCPGPCFQFDKMDANNVLNRAARELPARPSEGGAGVDLIAEPWAIGLGTYQVGQFPWGYAEWNGAFRDVVRTAQNKLGVATVTPRSMAERLLGSPDLFADDGRPPSASINFVVAHDGFTLRDLYGYDGKHNEQPQPRGPSSGGTDDNISWDQGGRADEQEKAARTGFLLLAVASGVPMMLGGDELYRTQFGNNNAYNLDNASMWLGWEGRETHASFHDFVRGALALRHAHRSLRPRAFAARADRDGNGLADVMLLGPSGIASAADLDDGGRRFVAVRFDGDEAGDTARSVYVAYNWDAQERAATLPAAAPGFAWYLAADSDAGVAFAPGSERVQSSRTLLIARRSAVVLVER